MIDGSASAEVLTGGGTIVTATPRLARQIQLRHDQARLAAGARAWPTADVLPLDAWLRRAWEANAVGERLLGRLRLLAENESRLVWRRVLLRGGAHRPDAGVIVPLVANGWRLCQSWGIRPQDLAAAAESDDSRAFAGWVAAYAAELARRGWLDSGGLLTALGSDGTAARAAGESTLGFAGFEPWTPSLAALAAALEEAGASVHRSAPPARAGHCLVVSASDERDELARACRWAAGHATKDSGASVAIITPDLEQDAGQVRRTALGILAPGWQLREPRSRPVALAIGRSLVDYPVVACALGVLRLLTSDASFEEASLLLRSAYLVGAEAERGSRAGAELRLRRLPLERIRVPTLLRILGEDASMARGCWRQADGLAATERRRQRPPSEWAGHFTAWLMAAGWPGDRSLASEEYQAAEAWQHLLESFAGTDEVAGTLALGAALELLTQQARDRAFEPESPAGAIQVLTLREAEGQDFDALWVCGLTADEWPPPARPHPLIPLALQQAVGIPEAAPATLEAHTRRRFSRLLASAGELVLSWPAQWDETETLPSPLLAGLDGPGDEPGGTTQVLYPDRERIAASAALEECATDVAPALPSATAVPGGARVLALQAICPARAFVEIRLRGAALDPPARPLDLATRGRIVHRLFERLYRLPACSRGLGGPGTSELREAFAGLVGGVLDEFLPAGDAFLDHLRPLEEERLWALVLSLRELDKARPAFDVVTEVERRVRVGLLELSVRLDRLDRLEDDGELVLDYKTGQFAFGGWKRPRLPESQLPLYAVTAGSRGLAVIQLRPGGGLLRGIGADGLDINGMKTAAQYFRDVSLDWPGALERWRVQLETLAGEFCAGDFRVNPADERTAGGQFAGLTRIHDFLPVADDDGLPEGAEE